MHRNCIDEPTGILENNGVNLTPSSKEFRDFKTFVATAFRRKFSWKKEKKGFPSYVFDKDFSLFRKKTTLYWHLTPLNKTFLPFLKEEFRDVHNPDNMMPVISTCQLLLGHAMSFTSWHTENFNLPYINYHHSG
ncbi:hypothetical protein OUZ56_016817 [Daphnia magna]|uniref:JmjC domain-containing protein n=1 Tax=Daphnia magna TaxID=35525 RepID=A0ABR0ARQ9_9CRUS|nr:hypothetical protein OUZ56_016817 [Daphnia magna]